MNKLVTLATIVVALVATGSAQADCYDTSAAEVDPPSTAGAGNTIKFQAYNDRGDGAILTVEAADPARPISHPYTRANLPDDYFTVAVQTEPGDGPVRVRINWTETSYYPAGEQCSFERVGEIKLVRALKTTRPTFRNYYDENLRFNLLGKGRCNLLASPMPASITISGAGGSWRSAFKDLCTGSSFAKRKKGRPPFSISRDGQVVVFHPSPAARKSWQRKYRYAIKVGGKIRETGVIGDYARFYPGHKVWVGTDEYWNYCVNGGHTVYAENGNYYCWNSAWQDRNLTAKRQLH